MQEQEQILNLKYGSIIALQLQDGKCTYMWSDGFVKPSVSLKSFQFKIQKLDYLSKQQ